MLKVVYGCGESSGDEGDWGCCSGDTQVGISGLKSRDESRTGIVGGIADGHFGRDLAEGVPRYDLVKLVYDGSQDRQV